MIAVVLTIFTGAFLLFEVQPLLAKFILPWFGGSPGVWTTCMLFFQLLLLSGYGYAHLVGRLSPRAQAVVHGALLVVATLLLPITPATSWKPAAGSAPELRILLLLASCVGIHALVLASTGPLVQSWFHRVRPGRSPYPLYAVSNLGSLLALVSYPSVIEPNLSRVDQARFWSIAFGVFVAFSMASAVLVWRAGTTTARDVLDPVDPPSTPVVRPIATRLLWFLFPACGCVLLLATTNQICVNVSVVPFLWILPLGLYLLSFIFVFAGTRWYPRVLCGVLLPVGIAGVLAVLQYSPSIVVQIAAYCAVLFVCCMVCHGELVRLKPEPAHLTSFYLMIAAGGAAGGAFVALLAPHIFRGYFEPHVGLVACGLLALAAYALDERSVLRGGRPRWAWALLGLLLACLSGGLAYEARRYIGDVISISRNFYGVLSVSEEGSSARTHRYVLYHGTVIHGSQFDDPAKRRWPTTYYGWGSGVGLSVRHLQKKGPVRIGVVGLGAGTIAAWGRKGDSIRFYEIDPEVKRLAETRFTYLADSQAEVRVVLGDGRISLEREEDQRFDVLVLDAFSGDAIPVHLLTKDAFETYLRHLKPDGLVAVNIANDYLDFQPVLFLIANHFGLDPLLINNDDVEDPDDEAVQIAQPERSRGLNSSSWVLLTRNPAFLQSDEVRHAASTPEAEHQGVRLWTDDDTNLFRILQR